MRKVVLSACVVGLVCFAGCGKKADKEDIKIVQNVVDEDQLKAIQPEIPLYEEEKFFDSESVENFAFVDEEEDLDLIKEEAVPEQVASAESEDWSAEEDLSLAWEDSEIEEVEFKTVNFELNKNSISKDQKELVAHNLKAAKEAVDSGKDVIVAGHCCPLGSASFNMSLSEKRAKAVRDEMVKEGIPADHVKVLGCGSESPIVLSDASERGTKIKELAPNRRAEISIN
ncbi:OmpA family protein [Candidatus Babeliales bacterium]|nr:OmpA family protein [Candidatus Babeliales bacterium]